MVLKWGILGLGKIAHHFCKDLLLVDGNELYAVASRSQDKANTFGDRYQSKKCYGSYEDLLQDEEVDVVYIATPHNSHLQYASQALEAGKHVLCEKPLAVNQSEVHQLIECATKSQVFLMEALWSRFNPAINGAMSAITNGTIGHPTYLHSTFSFHKDIDLHSRLFNPNLAGGAILDVGIYPVFLSYILFGMPNSIAASGKLSEQGVDLQVSVMLDYDGASAQLMCGLVSDCDMVSKVYGTAGQLYIDSRWHEAQSYRVHTQNQNITYKHPTTGRGYAHEIQECAQCIANGKLQSSLWSHQDSLNLIAILDELRRQVGVVYPFE